MTRRWLSDRGGCDIQLDRRRLAAEQHLGDRTVGTVDLAGPRVEVNFEVAGAHVLGVRCPDGGSSPVDHQVAVGLHDDVGDGPAVRARRPLRLVGGVIQDEVAVRLQDEIALARHLDLLPLVEALVGVHSEGCLRRRFVRKKQRDQRHENARADELHPGTSRCAIGVDRLSGA